jgi:hypothetical protein
VDPGVDQEDLGRGCHAVSRLSRLSRLGRLGRLRRKFQRWSTEFQKSIVLNAAAKRQFSRLVKKYYI